MLEQIAFNVQFQIKTKIHRNTSLVWLFHLAGHSSIDKSICFYYILINYASSFFYIVRKGKKSSPDSSHRYTNSIWRYANEWYLYFYGRLGGNLEWWYAFAPSICTMLSRISDDSAIEKILFGRGKNDCSTHNPEYFNTFNCYEYLLIRKIVLSIFFLDENSIAVFPVFHSTSAIKQNFTNM